VPNVRPRCALAASSIRGSPATIAAVTGTAADFGYGPSRADGPRWTSRRQHRHRRVLTPAGEESERLTSPIRSNSIASSTGIAGEGISTSPSSGQSMGSISTVSTACRVGIAGFTISAAIISTITARPKRTAAPS